MLRHAIPPARRYTKVSHDVVRHPRLNSDAKVLLIYVQGLPDTGDDKCLSAHAARLGITGRAFQKAKELLGACGFLHQWRHQVGRGRWVTDQLLANVTLTGEEAALVRDGVPPSAQEPTIGQPSCPSAGRSGLQDEDSMEEELPHPPPQASDAAPAEAEQVGESERVLLSLRHLNRDLLLGVREARELAPLAAEWLRRGVSGGDLARALSAGLPTGGVRSAAGFLRHRLTQKLPAASPPSGEGDTPPVRTLLACDGPGDEHLFRPLADETTCPRCRKRAAAAKQPSTDPTAWRKRINDLVAEAAPRRV